jgi:thiamine biosynthesis protein ThiC
MQLYSIRRRDGWTTPEALQATAARSQQVGDEEMSTDVRWIRSYVVHEADGGLGTVCIYQASSPEKIRDHATRVGMPADEITEVVDTVLVRPDPVPVAA